MNKTLAFEALEKAVALPRMDAIREALRDYIEATVQGELPLKKRRWWEIWKRTKTVSR